MSALPRWRLTVATSALWFALFATLFGCHGQDLVEPVEITGRLAEQQFNVGLQLVHRRGGIPFAHHIQVTSTDPKPTAVATRPNSLNVADECFEVTEENLDDFVNVNVNPNGKSILRLHSVNARYVQHLVHEDRILAVCYSYIKEGVGVNVIATAVEGGFVRFWSSWNLSFVSELTTGTSPIRR